MSSVNITFRTADVSDVELLIDLYNQSFYSDYIRYGCCPGYGRTIESMSESINRYPKQIAVFENVPVGVLSTLDDGNGNINVGCLCVIPEYQNRGIGMEIMNHISFIYPDWKSINLITPTDKAENIYFYTKKCGLSIMGEKYDGSVKVSKLLKRRDSKPLSVMSFEELWNLFPIVLEKPNKIWLEWYRDEEKLLQSKLPMKKIKRISHIGSTSVQTIWAKPIVDILVEVCDNIEINEIATYMINCGYILMSDSDGRMTFNKGYTREGFADRVFHLHLRKSHDNDEMYFRDYLIDNPQIAHEYENLKLGLLKIYEHNRDKYTNAKTNFVRKYTCESKKNYKERY